MSKIASADTFDEKEHSLLLIIIGVVLLTTSLLTSARLGVYQEVLFSKYGKQSREAVFYCVSALLFGFVFKHELVLKFCQNYKTVYYSTFYYKTIIILFFCELFECTFYEDAFQQ